MGNGIEDSDCQALGQDVTWEGVAELQCDKGGSDSLQLIVALSKSAQLKPQPQLVKGPLPSKVVTHQSLSFIRGCN